MSNAVYNFEELVIWQLSRQFVREIYLLFRESNDYGFRDQIQRASVSVMNNIAEGTKRVTDLKEQADMVNTVNAATIDSVTMLSNRVYEVDEITK